MVLDVLVFILTNKGKEKRAGEVLEWLIGEVKEKEPDMHSYHVYTTHDHEKGTLDYVAYLRIKDETILAQRPNLGHHHEVAKIIKEEDLLREPLKYLRLEDYGGWDR
ncbi:hypothetical protein B0A49_09568 [Cryomyces minteri]|uniref:ABM domain-containing protein n=1 Tax=Cryomyces minteri TaxID=331657 RepID=A0A4U0WLI3_9PEZI|nr:hypothetical protein B0A49_09568 [Cryomyces minteri]